MLGGWEGWRQGVQGGDWLEEERENPWDPFMGGERGVMADSQVSGLGSGAGGGVMESGSR